MLNTLRLYLHYASLSIRTQMQYRASFVTHAIAHFLITITEFLGLAAVFQRFGTIQGWTLPQVGFFYGLISLAFALAEAIPRGFDIFHTIVRSGDFDRVLLRPRASAFQIFSQEFQLMRIGRFSQGLIILVISAAHLPIAWSAPKFALTLFAILGGACLFSGLFILQATLCFWTIDSIEIVNCTTYGGVEAGQFPLTIYRPWFRRFFTFVIPQATINYFPAHAIFARPDPLGSTLLLQYLAPFAGIAFLFVSLQFWNFGVRHYRSTGS